MKNTTTENQKMTSGKQKSTVTAQVTKRQRVNQFDPRPDRTPRYTPLPLMTRIRYILQNPEQYLHMKAPINHLLQAKDEEGVWYPAVIINTRGSHVKIR